MRTLNERFPFGSWRMKSQLAKREIKLLEQLRNLNTQSIEKSI
jgi:hypothetical protein